MRNNVAKEQWMRVSRTTAVIAGTVLLPITAIVGSIASTSHVAAAAPQHTLQILVTNDDGYRARLELRRMSSALAKLPNVTVTVVAPPMTKQRDRRLHHQGQAQGHEAQDPEGCPPMRSTALPADTIRAALNQLHLRPDCRLR